MTPQERGRRVAAVGWLAGVAVFAIVGWFLTHDWSIPVIAVSVGVIAVGVTELRARAVEPPRP